MGQLDDIKRSADWAEKTGAHIQVGDCFVGSTKNALGLSFTWYGWSGARWRWNVSHIDIGPLSVYNLPTIGLGALFWRVVAIAMKPLRWNYHRRFSNPQQRMSQFKLRFEGDDDCI